MHDEAEIKALLFKWIRSSEPYAESVGQTRVTLFQNPIFIFFTSFSTLMLKIEDVDDKKMTPKQSPTSQSYCYGVIILPLCHFDL